MSKYTTEVRFICEHDAGLVESEGYSSINTILDNCVSKVFDFDFPIFDENYRTVLERKILKHYYTREIATETVGLWKHFLDMRLNEIMPYYNKLYESELLSFNPFYDVDITKDHIGNGTNDTEHERSDTETNTNTRTDNLTRTDDFTRTDNLTRTDDVTRTDDLTRTDNLTTDRDSERTDNLTRTDDFTRTDNLIRTDNLTTERDSERTDNLTRTDAFTRTDNLKSTSQDSGTQGESGSDVNKNTRWDTYSDTPQGALTNVANETYLTNARKIVDDGTGSTHSNTTTFGKKVVVDDTGTQQNGGTSKNTGTQEVDETETHTGTQTNTGTQRNGGTQRNTGTQVVDETETHTGTQKNTGTQEIEETESHTGTQRNNGTSVNTGTQRSDGNKSLATEFTTGIKTTEQYLEHVKGKSPGASYAKLLQEYRDTFLNIDMLIIEDLSDLFFGLW